ncbi:MAG: alkaline phosphatase family protein, partial [Gemmatimonadota bacterium]|nr:alkaline phosphatase family protein [Gemmatimonadota bacterium]
YPEWLNRFNAERMPGFVTDTVWENGVDEGSRGLARADSAVYENDGVHTTFPHHALEELDFGLPGALSSWNLGHPNADAAVFALAKEAIGALGLGRRGVVDYLSISLSATDYVGHGYGPFSQEQLDNLVRLDGGLGRFIDELDASVGTGGWVMALSADHGVQTMPEYLAAAGEPAVRVDWGERGRAIGSVVAEVERAVGTGDLLADSLAHRLEGSGLVEKAYTHRDLTRGEPADSFAALFQNSYFPGRAGGWISTKGVEVRFPPNHLVSGPTGTTHGSPYWYDRHVPIIFFGAGIEKGVSSDGVHTVDIAPTLAALAGISAPTDLDGRILIVP